MTILSLINFLLFVALSSLHVYWACGGAKWLNAALPEIESNKKVLNPGRFLTQVVATGLLLFAVISLGGSGILNAYVKESVLLYGNAAIAFIFFVRAIGDFKYVGFFKKVSHTVFSKNDTKYYSPLCLLIACIALIISYKLFSNN